jgi:hypothetical protein
MVDVQNRGSANDEDDTRYICDTPLKKTLKSLVHEVGVRALNGAIA